MKIECVKNKITDLVLKISRVAGKTQNLPVLGCVLLSVEGGNLTVSATNLDFGVVGELPVRVFKGGRAAVPAQVLSSLLSQLSGEGSIVFEVNNGNLAVSSGHSQTNIKLLNHEDYPAIPNITDGAHRATIPITDLLGGLQAVWYGAAASAMKPELSSIYVFQDQKQFVFVATDSFRLAEKRVVTKKHTELQPSLIPYKNAVDTIKVFDGVKGDVELVSTKNQASFFAAGIRAASRLIEGTFPDYQQIIPKNPKTEVVLLKQDLISALKTSTIFSGALHRVDFVVQPSKKLVTVSAESDHVGKNTTQLEAAMKGEEISISFNLRYLTDCFQSLPQDSITLNFSGPHKPLVIRGVGDNTFTYLVMPMNR